MSSVEVQQQLLAAGLQDVIWCPALLVAAIAEGISYHVFKVCDARPVAKQYRVQPTLCGVLVDKTRSKR